MKYIIKNCPNCWTCNRPKAVCGLTFKRGGFKDESESYRYCENEKKCLLKQIVEKCKSISAECFDQWCFANYILESLEIEEVNE